MVNLEDKNEANKGKGREIILVAICKKSVIYEESKDIWKFERNDWSK